MEKVSQTDIQDQLKKVKDDFDKIKDQLSPEVHAIFNTLFSLFNLMLLAFMTKFGVKSSRNSNNPPSQDPYRNRKQKNSRGKIGAP